MKLRAPTNGRPWSLPEIDQAIPQIVERLEDALVDLKQLGEREATLKWSYEHHEAVARVNVRSAFAGEKSVKEDRDAAAILYVFRAEDFPGGIPDPSFVGYTLADVGLAKDMAGNAYDNQRAVLRALQAELDTLRTLHVSGREHGPS